MDHQSALTALSATADVVGLLLFAKDALGVKLETTRVNEELDRQAWEEVTEAARNGWPEVEKTWPAENERPAANEVATICNEVVRQIKGATNGNKRALLRNAVVNAFDFDLYQEGLTRRLLDILEDLEYGDISLLSSIYQRKGKTPANLADVVQGDVGSLEYHHLRQLQLGGMVWTTAEPGSREWLRQGFSVAVTDLGERMLRLLQEPAPGGASVAAATPSEP